ncbi:MAG TPA: histidine--tRNA ligase [Methylomirabilota bacterium]|nr:histidine--tRNA ligase [Methylomirabilota bacterium]
MASKVSTTPPRGMRDLLPAEVELRDAATREILAVYRAFGYRRIETPALESLRLLVGSDGGENEKLIFKVLKRGEDLEGALRAGGELAEHGLRFDLTVPLARYYAENHARLPDPLKAIQIGPVWRAERPQKGRFRQFTQCDIDVLGVASGVAEVELILATAEALTRLGLADLTVRVNDRRLLGAIARHCGFPESAQGGFFIAFDKLDKIGPEGVLSELRGDGADSAAVERFERLLPTLQKGGLSLDALPALLGPDAAAAGVAFESLAGILRTVNQAMPTGARAEFDPTLVRGMGYYTGTIFEATSPAYPSAIAGGGRYDKMIGRMINRDVPACGFSIGFERLIGILSERAQAPGAPATAGAGARRVAFLVDEHGDLTPALAASRALRTGGDLVSLEVKRKNLGKQLETLATHGFTAYATCEAGGAPTVKPLTRRGRD